MSVRIQHLTVLLLAATLGMGSPVVVPDVQAAERPGVAQMLERVTPAVVNISVTGRVAARSNPLQSDPLFRRYFGLPDTPEESVPTQSVGSGVIIDADKGYILTNHHVIDKAESIEVTLTDMRRLDATLIGSDPATDVALLQVDAADLEAVPMADSSTLRVGDFVAAIGNPFGIGQTVTSGIVSALDRVGINRDGYEDFIQTDASINPGNSGGALVDYNGNLIGINSAIIAPSGGNVGIGFAVPINMARSVVDQLVEFGEVQRGVLGVTVTDVTPDVVQALGLKVRNGAVVQSVSPDSPAESVGLLPGDVIVAANGKAIKGASDLRNTIGLIRVGEKVNIDYMREEARHEASATIATLDAQSLAASPAADTAVQGATFDAVPEDDPNYGGQPGVLVTAVEQDSRAWNNGLRPGDVVTAVNRRPVVSVDDLQKLLGDGRGTVALNILRDNQSMFLIMR